MKRHLTLSTTSSAARDGRSGATDTSKGLAGVLGWHEALAEPSPDGPQLPAAGVPDWRHTLILTGTLDDCTAAELEDEIECLCQEGVTSLTVDLRRLETLASTGASVLAFAGRACKQRGRGFAVIPGSRGIDALAEAGVTDLVSAEESETVAHLSGRHAAAGRYSARSTAMVKAL